MSTGYNGWSNYETWRINLEMFDGLDASDYLNNFDADGCEMYEEGWSEAAVPYLTEMLANMADYIIDNDCPSKDGIAYDLAQDFLARVDFQEIAEHMVDDYLMENS